MLKEVISSDEAGSSLVQSFEFLNLMNFMGIPNTASIFHHGPYKGIEAVFFDLTGAFLNVAF